MTAPRPSTFEGPYVAVTKLTGPSLSVLAAIAASVWPQAMKAGASA